MVWSKSPGQLRCCKKVGREFWEMMILQHVVGFGRNRMPKGVFFAKIGCQKFQNHFRSYVGDAGRLS